MQAFVRIPQDLCVERLGLRVGAPTAAQRTPFEKNYGPYAGAVMDTEFLDIKDICFQLKSSFFGIKADRLLLFFYIINPIIRMNKSKY